MIPLRSPTTARDSCRWPRRSCRSKFPGEEQSRDFYARILRIWRERIVVTRLGCPCRWSGSGKDACLVNLSLDPEKFRSPLRFVWFPSSEGTSWRDGLHSGVSAQALNSYQLIIVTSTVAVTLSRVGNQKFRRHFEIKPLALGTSQNLIELRWHIQSAGLDLHLRLYCALRVEEGLLLGLCFRPKQFATNSAETAAAQNRDIQRALDLALQFQAENH